MPQARWRRMAGLQTYRSGPRPEQLQRAHRKSCEHESKRDDKPGCLLLFDALSSQNPVASEKMEVGMQAVRPVTVTNGVGIELTQKKIFFLMGPATVASKIALVAGD